MSYHRPGAAAAVPFLVLVVSTVAWADLGETTILPINNSTLNLESGAVGSSGGDLLWDGRNMMPQGATKVRNLPNLGFDGFDAFGLSYFSSTDPQVAAHDCGGSGQC